MSGWRGPRNCASLMAAGGWRGPSAWGAAGLRGRGGAIRRRRRRSSSWWVTNARRPAAGVCSAAWSRAQAGASWTLEPRGRGTRRLSALGGSLWTSPPVSVGTGSRMSDTDQTRLWVSPAPGGGAGRVGADEGALLDQLKLVADTSRFHTFIQLASTPVKKMGHFAAVNNHPASLTTIGSPSSFARFWSSENKNAAVYCFTFVVVNDKRLLHRKETFFSVDIPSEKKSPPLHMFMVPIMVSRNVSRTILHLKT